MSTLIKRILSAIVLAPLVIAALLYGGWVFYAMMAVVFTVSLLEWSRLSNVNDVVHWGILFAGVFYLGIACLAMVWVRGDDVAGFYLLLYVLLAVWLTDTGAYIAGRAIGGPKMAPSISPNKTWAGLIGGVCASVAVLFFYAFFLADNIGMTIIAGFGWWLHILFGVVLAVFGQIGDLLISRLKRRAGVKDTGNIIPGHGGLLDRIDALILCVPIYAGLLLALGILKL